MVNELSKSLLVNTLWSFIGRFGYLAVALISNIILVRLLTPEDFGQIAIVMFFIAIASVIVESGLSGALIRKKNVKDIDYSTVFVFNMLISLMLIGLFGCLSTPIALFYDNPEIRYILIVSSLILIINGFRVTQNTKLIRDLKFKIKAFYEFISILIGSSIGIILAYNEFGVWAIVISQLITALTLTCIFWIFVEPIKSIKFSFNSFKNIYKFGINTTLASLLNTIFDNIYQLILGKYFSISQSGYFYQAKKLQDIPNGILEKSISSVIYSTLSKLQSNPKEFNKLYFNVVRLSTVIVSLIFMLVFYYADFIIIILYGNTWIDSALYLKLLVIASFFYIQENLNRIIFKVFNKTEKILQLEVLKKIIQSLTIGYALYVESIEFLLYGFILTNIVSFILNYYIARCIQKAFSLRDLLNTVMIIVSTVIIVFSCDSLSKNMGYNRLYNLPLIFLTYFYLLYLLNIFKLKEELNNVYKLFRKSK